MIQSVLLKSRKEKMAKRDFGVNLRNNSRTSSLFDEITP